MALFGKKLAEAKIWHRPNMETLQRTANRGSVSTGYDIDNSLKLEDDNTENLYRALNGSTSTTKFTISMWAKRTEINGSQLLYHRGVAGNEGVFLRFATENASYPEALQVDIGASGTNSRSYTTASFRDTSAWYHVVLAVDTTQSTATDRFKLYVNGNLITDFASRNNPAEDFAMEVSSAKHRHGAYNDTDGFAGYCGYIAECHYIDGSQVAQTEFGEFDEDSGIWKPKAYAGSYGTGGYYLDFEASGDLGANAEGDGVDFTLNNIAAADQSTDTPTNNFCTLNPLVNFKYGTNAGGMTNGATVFGDNTGGGVGGAFGTMAVTAGKWYWEVKLTEQVAHYIGISAYPDDGDNVLSTSDPHQVNSSFVFNISGARIEYINGGSVTAGSADAFTDFHSVGDVISIALNMDDNQISMYGNGTLQAGVANTSIFDAANKMVVPFHATINDECQYNFGGYSVWTPSSVQNDENGYGTFEYAPPSGYYALCTQNLALYGG